MADWRELRGPGSFRDVPFVVESTDVTAGRRQIIHEYPLRKGIYAEDLGEAPRRFSVAALVVGDDYIAARDAVQAAVMTAGPGVLVLPYYGRVTVVCQPVKFVESAGGVCRFTLDFIESDDSPLSPTVTSAPATAAATSAQRAQLAISNSVVLRYGLTAPGLSGKPLPAFSLTSVSGLIGQYGAHLNTTLAPLIKDAQKLATFRSQIDAIVDGAAGLARDPLRLVSSFSSVLSSFLALPMVPRLGVASLLRASQFLPTTARPEASTPIRAIEQQNYDTVDHFVRAGLVAQAVALAATAATLTRVTSGATSTGTAGSGDDYGGYDSREDAIAVRDALVDVIDGLLQSSADDDEYDALSQLGSDLVAAVPGEQSQLPQLVTVIPEVTTTSLALHYRLFESLSRESDTIARNKIAYPSFIVGGVPLQVLADGD